MKKIYKLVLLLIIFFFLTTYSPNQLSKIPKKENNFFKVQNIEIVNNDLIKKEELNEKLNYIYNKNIFLIKRNDIEESLKSIDFLDKIEVKKKYPNTIRVRVFETKPMGILHKKGIKYLLDSSSNLILFSEEKFSGNLPNIIGDGGEKNFINFFEQLKVKNFPIDKIKNYYYFKINRWDLELQNNKIIKLPSNKVENAIQQSIELFNREDFKDYNIIDLRVYGKIVVE